jgi:hypothetical protein
MTTYRVVFETVAAMRLKEFCDADPAYYSDTTQLVPNSAIPDDAWYEVTGNPTDDPWDQHATLTMWDAQDLHFVRKVRLEKLAAEPVWEEVTDSRPP